MSTAFWVCLIPFSIMFYILIDKWFDEDPCTSEKKENKFKVIDFFDELKDHMQYVMNVKKLQYADKILGRHLICKYIYEKDKWMGKSIDCDHILIRFHLLKYSNGSLNIHARVEVHHGTCHWDGKEMHYDYPRYEKEFQSSANDFPNLWMDILKFCYSKNGEIEEVTIEECESLPYWRDQIETD